MSELVAEVERLRALIAADARDWSETDTAIREKRVIRDKKAKVKAQRILVDFDNEIPRLKYNECRFIVKVWTRASCSSSSNGRFSCHTPTSAGSSMSLGRTA